jgi:hypothetical protein
MKRLTMAARRVVRMLTVRRRPPPAARSARVPNSFC